MPFIIWLQKVQKTETVWAKYCDDNNVSTNCLGRKRVGGVYKLLTKSPHFKITRPAYPPLLSIGLARCFVSNFK